MPTFPADAKGMATRDASGQGAQRHREERAVADRRFGRPGPFEQDAADVRGRRRFERRQPGGRNLHFGIREHAMGAILNGLSLSKVRPYRIGHF